MIESQAKLIKQVKEFAISSRLIAQADQEPCSICRDANPEKSWKISNLHETFVACDACVEDSIALGLFLDNYLTARTQYNYEWLESLYDKAGHRVLKRHILETLSEPHQVLVDYMIDVFSLFITNAINQALDDDQGYEFNEEYHRLYKVIPMWLPNTSYMRYLLGMIFEDVPIEHHISKYTCPTTTGFHVLVQGHIMHVEVSSAYDLVLLIEIPFPESTLITNDAINSSYFLETNVTSGSERVFFHEKNFPVIIDMASGNEQTPYTAYIPLDVLERNATICGVCGHFTDDYEICLECGMQVCVDHVNKNIDPWLARKCIHE